MFYAFIVACAAYANLEVDRSNCLTFQDTLGPYQTFELCAERAEEMIAFAIEGNARLSIMSVLGKPPIIYVEGICSEDESELV